MKKPLSGREEYYHEIRKVERDEPFSTKEKKAFTTSQREFIRAIQITRGMSKKEAIKHFKKNVTGKGEAIRKEKELFDRRYTGRVSFSRKATLRKVKQKKGYEYAHVVTKAPKSLKDRFIPDYSTSARRYLDTATNEVISRRERDKRIAEEIRE